MRTWFLWLGFRALSAIAILACGTLASAEDGATRDDWPSYGGRDSAWRYSALQQINRSNVRHLKTQWVFQTGKIDGGLNATPVVVGGVMYLSSSWNRVFAIDAVTGNDRSRGVHHPAKLQIAHHLIPHVERRCDRRVPGSVSITEGSTSRAKFELHYRV